MTKQLINCVKIYSQENKTLPAHVVGVRNQQISKASDNDT